MALALVKGSSQDMNAGNGSAVKPTVLSFGAWVKKAAGEAFLFGNMSRDGGTNERGFRITLLNATYAFSAIVGDGNGLNYQYGYAGGGELDTGWHHVFFTFSAGTLHTYLDGVLNETGNGGSVSAPGYHATYNALRLGSYSNSGTMTYYSITGLAWVQLYPYALSAGEVKALVNQHVPLPEKIGDAWPLLSNGNSEWGAGKSHGTLNGSPTFSGMPFKMRRDA